MPNASASARMLAGGRAKWPTDRLAFFERHIRPLGPGTGWAWDGHEYLRAPLLDDAEFMVWQKAAQGGWTVAALGLGCQDCVLDYNVGYYLNDRAFLAPFIQDKLDPLINADPALAAVTGVGDTATGELDAGTRRARRKSADNLRVKHIGGGAFWFQGMQTVKDIKSITLDRIIVDEVNEVNQALRRRLWQRMLHSSRKRELYLSQPSVPDFGINELYEQSDCKTYQHRCPKCRRWHILEDEFPSCLQYHQPKGGRRGGAVVLPLQSGRTARERGRGEDAVPGEWRIVCVKCGGQLHPAGARVQREWVPAYPERPISGYRFSQVYGPVMDGNALARLWAQAQRNRDALEEFTISVLGNPFAGDKQPLTTAVLDRASGMPRSESAPPGAPPQDPWPLGLKPFLRRFVTTVGFRPFIVAGIDVGDHLHAVKNMVWDNMTYTVDFQHFPKEGSAEDAEWEQLYRWLRDTDFWLIDALPYKPDAKRLCRRDGMNGGIIYTSMENESVGWEDQHLPRPVRAVKTNRNDILDEYVSDMVAGLIRLPDNRVDEFSAFRRHHIKLTRVFDEKSGKLVFQDRVENHYGMAGAHAHLAARIAPAFAVGPAQPLGDLSSWSSGRAINTSSGEDDDW